MGAVRAVARILAIVAAVIACVPLHYATLLLRGRSAWPRRFLWWVGRAAGFRAVSVGTPLPSHVLFLANHLSWLDIMILAGATGTAFVSRDDVGRWPVIGWLAGLNHTVYVDRSDRRAVASQADSVRAALAGGRPVALFPEGTTDGGTRILPFRASLLASLFPPLPGVRVQPVAVDYGAAGAEIAWTGSETAAQNLKKVLARRGAAQVTLHFLEPMEPAEWADRKALANAARERIVAALDGR